MSIPSTYQNSAEYFEYCLKFLKTYSWFYNYKNTHILVNNVLDNFPPHWVEYFKNLTNEELNKLPLNYVKDNCPDDLRSLLDNIHRMKPNIKANISKCDYELSHNSGLSDKKLHEILFFAPLIDTICKENSCNFIIDVGSGLGYLSHLLHEEYNYPVLGIECSPAFINLAYKNQEKHYPRSKNFVTFTEHFIDKNSSEPIAQLIDHTFNKIEVKTGCIVGLHACADLSITILELFLKLDSVKCLVIMPCCYHRIKIKFSEFEEEKEVFENFPASTSLIKTFKECEAETFLKRPFLRLACQQSVGRFIDMSEEEHEKHSRNCLFRAILQDVSETEHLQINRLKRKSYKSQISNADEDFEACLASVKNTHKLSDQRENLDYENFQSKMREKWLQHKEKRRLIEILTGFQATLQCLCENLILLDRVEFLKDNGVKCAVQKVTDDLVSPRCYALIASKS